MIKDHITSGFSLGEFYKIRTILASRTFEDKIQGKKTSMIVPLADMINHAGNYNEPNTSWKWNEARDGFLI